jgi:hypothetical protein
MKSSGSGGCCGSVSRYPLIGLRIVREEPSGKLYVLEANAIGYVWNFTARSVADFGFLV